MTQTSKETSFFNIIRGLGNIQKLVLFKKTLCYKLLALIPKKKGLILFNAWFGQKYTDNPMYVYEYLLENSNYNVVWITRNINIYNNLRAQNKPVELMDSLKGKWQMIRAQAVFSTVQFLDYNQNLLSKTIYIDLGHGHPIKDPGKSLLLPIVVAVQKLYVKHLYYYAICASDFSKEKYQEVVSMNPDHIIISDFARNDVFVDKSLRKGKNTLIDEIKGTKKAIVYMPSQRSAGKKIMAMKELLPLQDIQTFCKKNDYVFIVKKHFYHRNETENFDKYNCIFDVTQVEDIDPQVLLFQADLLITDYSACYIDYLLLNRPIMFYQYDIEEFKQTERTLYYSFEQINIAPIAYNKDEFTTKLSEAISSDDNYCDRRNEFAKLYFSNRQQKDGRYKIKLLLDKLINIHFNQ